MLSLTVSHTTCSVSILHWVSVTYLIERVCVACSTTDVQGTVNLLSSVAKAGKSVKRVVLTSSVAAMTPLSMSNGKGWKHSSVITCVHTHSAIIRLTINCPRPFHAVRCLAAPPMNGEAYNEADWNTDSDLEHPYALSKVHRATTQPCHAVPCILCQLDSSSTEGEPPRL